METIIYQGEHLTAERVADINTVRGHGTDTLYRDEEGRYYFERCLETGFLAVHRVNISAAILWAIETTGAFRLRWDAADCLMAHRSYDDPWPADAYHEIRAERGDQSAEEWVARILAGEEVLAAAATKPHRPDGLDTPTLTLSKTQWGMLRQAARCDKRDPEEWAMSVLGDNVALTLKDFYGHDEERAKAGWDGKEQKPPRGCTVQVCNPDGSPRFRVAVTGEGKEMLEARARANGTDLGTEYLAMIREGVAPSAKDRAMTVRLDPEAAALVRQYHEVSPYDYSSDDIASGCVFYLLTMAFGNQEEAERMTGLDSPDFHDGEWGTAEREFYEAQNRRAEQGADETEATATGKDEADFDLSGPAVSPAFSGRRPTRSLAEMALLNAAKPVSVEEDEEPILEEEHVEDVDTEQPRPIRALLLEVAADWRTKAREARTEANDLKPFAAAHKLAGQADLLEQCADQLVATLDGKEGQ